MGTASELGGACERHPDQPTTSFCANCNTPICRECTAKHGYYCSAECVAQARSGVSAADKAAQAEAQKGLFRLFRMIRVVGILIMLGAVGLGGFWVYRLFFDPAGTVAWQWQCDAKMGEVGWLESSVGLAELRLADRVVALNPRDGSEARATKLQSDVEDGPAVIPAFGGRRWFLGADSGTGTCQRAGEWLIETWSDRFRATPVGGGKSLERHYELGAVQLLTVCSEGKTAFYLAASQPNMPMARRIYARMKAAEKDLQKRTQEATTYTDEGMPIFRETKATRAARKRVQAAQAELAKADRTLMALDLATGENVWIKRVRPTSQIEQLVHGGGKLLLVMSKPAKKDGEVPGQMLLALDAATGKKSWQTDLPERLSWGPVYDRHMILVRIGQQVHGIRENGEAIYALAAAEEGWTQPTVKDGLLFMSAKAGTTCYNVADGKELWKVPLSVDGNDVVLTSRRIFVRGVLQEASALADQEVPEQFKELGLGGGGGPKTRIVPILSGIDRETGEVLWTRRNVYGRVVGDEERLVEVVDTAETSMLEMASGGKGETYIMQINPRTGKNMVRKRHELGFSNPVVHGERVLGIVYERSEGGGTMSIGMFGGGASSEPTRILGVAAFHLR